MDQRRRELGNVLDALKKVSRTQFLTLRRDNVGECNFSMS